MKNYIIYVGENNERKGMVLDALKKAGFWWAHTPEVEDVNSWLFLNTCNDKGCITHIDSWEYVAKRLMGEQKYYPLDASWVVHNAHELDGAKPKEPEVELDGKKYPVKRLQALIDAALDFGEGNDD